MLSQMAVVLLILSQSPATSAKPGKATAAESAAPSSSDAKAKAADARGAKTRLERLCQAKPSAAMLSNLTRVSEKLDTQIKTHLASCLSKVNKSATNPQDVLSVMCDQSLFKQTQTCLQTALRSSGGKKPKEAATQVRKAVTELVKALDN